MIASWGGRAGRLSRMSGLLSVIVATRKCKCDTIMRDDEFSEGEFDVDLDPVALYGRATKVWRCPTCGRLWIFWNGTEPADEYLAIEA